MTGHIARAQTEVAADRPRVWEALTDPDQVARYMMGTRVETDWQVGSPITWTGEMDGKPYQDKGEVLRADPGWVLEVTHYSPLLGKEDRPENYHTVRFELAASDGGTVVTLSQDGCSDERQAEQFSQSWQAMLDGMKQVVESS
jgi:uncharacterized protein YndB with AHSA1/START domain